MFMTTRVWRIMMMNREEIVKDMITYIEEAERVLQASKVSSDSKSVKNDIVNDILDKLEKEVHNEN